MLDRYIYGSTDRLSPEAPVPVLLAEREESRLGGAGTVVRNISALGAEAIFISVVGADTAGHDVTALIGNETNITPFIITDKERITTRKVRHISGNHQISRVDHETGAIINERIENQLLDHVRANIKDCHAVTLSDYGKGVLTKKVISRIISLAGDVPVIVDPKAYDFNMYAGATVLTPNIHELKRAGVFSSDVPAALKDGHDIVELARILMKPVCNMLVTRGRDGMTIVQTGGLIQHIPATAKEVYDVTGAGDTVVAVLALGMASGLSLYEASYLANKAAGIVVGKIGTATVSPEELCV